MLSAVVAALRALGTDLHLAATFLTRLPLPGSHAAPAGRSLAMASRTFPLIGTLIGLSGAAVMALVLRLGGDPLTAALLSVGFVIGLTGALHEDGLADLCDGLGGGRSPTERLAIMRDSRIGSFGAIALILSVALRASVLSQFADPAAIAAALAIAGGLSRAGQTARPSRRR